MINWLLGGLGSGFIMSSLAAYFLWRENKYLSQDNNLLQKEKEAIISDKQAVENEYRESIDILRQTAIQKNDGAIPASELLKRLDGLRKRESDSK